MNIQIGARCYYCLHYETSYARAELTLRHCPSCERRAYWLPVKESEVDDGEAPTNGADA